LSITNGHGKILDMATLEALITAYLDTIAPHVDKALVVPARVGFGDSRDFPHHVEIVSKSGAKGQFRPELRTSHLSRASAAGLVARVAKAQGRGTTLLLLAPSIGRPLGEYLREHGVGYIDRAGNCFLELMDGSRIQVEGRRAPKQLDVPRTMRAEALKVVFAYLAEPDLLDEPVRHVAEVAGVGKSTVANTLGVLKAQQFTGRSLTRNRLLDVPRLLDVWTSGYQMILRPKLLIGRYRSLIQEPLEIIRAFEGTGPEAEPWALGGTSGAYRVEPWYRNEEVTVHVDGVPRELLAAVGAAPSREGSIILLHGIGTIGYKGLQPRTVHPLLIYAELMASLDSRAHAAAEMLRETYLSMGVSK